MDFYALAWLGGFGFVGVCLLCVAHAAWDLADAVRQLTRQEQP